MGRVPALDLKEIEAALTENPRFMFGLDAQALPRVQPSETLLQLLYYFVVHTEQPLKLTYGSPAMTVAVIYV
jgi:hypothetical protein